MLTLQFVPYAELENLESEARINKLLGIVKDEKVVLLEGRLTKLEEASLIEKTMKSISGSFKGIEIATIDASSSGASFRTVLTNLLAGNRLGVTIIGPATIVKEIKKQPDKLQLLMHTGKTKKGKK